MEVRSHLDFIKKSQLINVVLHKVSTLPTTGWEGGVVYLTTNNRVYYHNGTDWVDITDITNLIGGGGITITGTGDDRTITIDPDNNSLELSDGTNTAKIRIMDKGVTFSKIQDIPTMTVIGRLDPDENGLDGVPSGITIITDLDVTISAHNSVASSKAIKDYIEQMVGSLGSMQGGFNASTETTFPSNANKGDYWYVTAPGIVKGIKLNIGDVLIANIDNASTTDPAEWTFLETNRDQAATDVLGVVYLATDVEAQAMIDSNKVVTPSNLLSIRATDAETQGNSQEKRFVTPKGLSTRTATEARTGIIEIANQAEVNTGTDDERAVTPLKLKTILDNQTASSTFTDTIGDGVDTSIVVTHNLNSFDVLAKVYKTTNKSDIIVDITRTTANSVTVTFNSAPAENEYTILIQK